MRFKAKLASDQVSLLYSVIAPLSKLQDNFKGAVLYLDRDFVRISAKNEITSFAELSNQYLFMEHRIESAANNVIVVQVDLVSLKLALQSVVSPNNSNNNKSNSSYANNRSQQHNNTSVVQSLLGQQTVILKLAKRNNMPCLCLEGRSEVDIHQAIPVHILRPNEMQYHLPPQIPTPTVQLELPMDRPIRTIVDKLKSMGPHIYLEASRKGDLTIRLDQEGASLACFYHNLVPRWEEEEEEEKNATTTTATVKVDAAKLSACLQWQQSSLFTSSCLLGMVPNEILVLHVLLHPEAVGFFTYYLPVYILQEDEVA
jgi:hypothetical protein